MLTWLVATPINDFLYHFLVILTGAGVAGLLMQRLRLPPIPVYLITGTIIGPDALGFVEESASIQEIGHLAIILLLFGIGLDLHISALKHRLARMLTAAVTSIAASTLLGWPVAIWFGLPALSALAVCMGLSLSSTAVVLRLIAHRRELRRTSGRMALSILVVQDLAALAMMGTLPLLARLQTAGSSRGAQSLEVPDVLFGIGRILLVLGFALTARRLLPKLVSESVRGRSLELLTIIGIAAALGTAVAIQQIGFSLEMGAFLAGFALAGTEFRHQLSAQIGPLRDLFIAVFFTTLGMRVDPAIVAEHWWVVGLATIVLMGMKTVIIAASCWAVGTTMAVALSVGFSLAQAGEFSLVLVSDAQRRGLVSPHSAAVIISVIVVSLILTPAMVRLGSAIRAHWQLPFLAPWIHNQPFAIKRKDKTKPEPTRIPVVMAGFGPVGQRIAAELARLNVPFLVVELNPRTIHQLQARRIPTVFGDIGSLEVLASAGIDRAKYLVLTIPDEDAVLQACRVTRANAPNVRIIARVANATRLFAVKQAGAHYAIVDELATAEQMLEDLLSNLANDRNATFEDPERERPAATGS